jgi:multicomponent K+:H+ antiporter subunit D
MSMHLTALPILLPLIGGFLILFARSSGLALQRKLNLLLTATLIVVAAGLLNTAASGVHQVYLLGNWPAPFGIVLVLDKLSALMVLMTALLAFAALCYGISENTDRQGEHFHVLFQIQLFGLNGAFLTGDLFNLFVFFEILLLASYGLLLHGGGRLRTKSGLHYVIINLIGSSLFLFAVGTLYGVTGTLNIADMAAKMAAVDVMDQGIVGAAALLLLVVFGIKAAIFPLYLWLPGAYAHTSAPVAALFAIMTKVGLYAIIRVHGTVFADQAGALTAIHADVLLVLGMLTLLMAVLGVTAARALREQVAYLILASVATLLIGIGINQQQALAATLYYLIHSTFIGGALFLLADIIVQSRGSVADKFRSAPAMSSSVIVGSIFLAAAVAMVGMPPLSGFFGKVLLLEAALNHNGFAWIFAAVLLGSLLMVIAMARSGSMLFYQTQQTTKSDGRALNKKALIVMLLLLSTSPLLVIFAHPVSNFTAAVAEQLLNTDAYIQAVLNQPVTSGER